MTEPAKLRWPARDGTVAYEAKLEAAPCKVCKMLMNGPHQYLGHRQGTLDRKTMNNQHGARPRALSKAKGPKAETDGQWGCWGQPAAFSASHYGRQP